ncbi:hypothetical protein [Bradyrhizobium sp.]|uniref:hypothetical protein n=1 Tax=Bradyrhizobium sp. TaxID=376 RepID=UPI002DDD8F25|nr:hypothetical protein [Bradyrhizobium sp.]HEV2153150.1 hypothetical protein [Bradyrhizobium sp.]
MTGEVNCADDLSLCTTTDIFPPKAGIDMLDRTGENGALDERRRLGDYLLPIVFLGAAGAAMIAWIGALGWASWWLITSLF